MARTRVRWGRVAVLVIAAALLLVLLAGAAAGVQRGTAEREAPVPTRTHLVRPGETVWSIADGISPPGADVRPLVDRIVELNDLGTLEAGRTIVVPATGG